MASSYTNGTVDEILSRCNIIDVIGSVVSLRKSGANYIGLCPFHNEKTPSFVVSENKQIFTCFGCHKSGNVIKFVMLYYNLSFMEAVEKLADQYGIEFRRGRYNNARNQKYFDVNTAAARFFFRNLRRNSNSGLEYMIKRGMTRETLHDFGIGYADDSWNSLYNHLKSQGFDEKTMMEAGLISKSGSRYYDKFRDRVIFPIQNTMGKVIGFGGRAIGDQMPKYLNSPETPVFSKKNNLYGLNITKDAVSSENRIILVEGYMDVVSLYQSGVKNVAASLGTALTENQARLIKRFTKNVTLSYDSDSAGVAAAVRGSGILHDEGLKVRVLHVTDGKDPDEFVKEHGRLKYIELVDNAMNYGDYIVESISRKYDIDTVEGRVEFLKEVAEFLRTMSPVEAEVYIEKISSKFHLSQGALRNEMNMEKASERKMHPDRRSQEEWKENGGHDSSDMSKIEQNIIRILLTDSTYFAEVQENREVFTSVTGNIIFRAMEDLMEKTGDIEYNRLLEYLQQDEVAALNNIYENVSIGGGIETVFRECMQSYRDEWLAGQEKELITLINIADEQNNSSEVEKLTEELMKIQKAKILRGKI